jgi:hypothetical protein
MHYPANRSGRIGDRVRGAQEDKLGRVADDSQEFFAASVTG